LRRDGRTLSEKKPPPIPKQERKTAVSYPSSLLKTFILFDHPIPKQTEQGVFEMGKHPVTNGCRHGTKVGRNSPGLPQNLGPAPLPEGFPEGIPFPRNPKSLLDIFNDLFLWDHQ
jgi:hypothetical protein